MRYGEGREPEGMVTISEKEYESLKQDSLWLTALEDAGVDNWSGYSFARKLLADYDNV